MFKQSGSNAYLSPLYLVTAICWGVMWIGGLWLDFHIRHAPLSLWREVWDFLLGPFLFLGNVFVYQRHRAKERRAA
jgi:hypothetical protein